jgi:hypothetical protein
MSNPFLTDVDILRGAYSAVDWLRGPYLLNGRKRSELAKFFFKHYKLEGVYVPDCFIQHLECLLFPTYDCELAKN